MTVAGGESHPEAGRSHRLMDALRGLVCLNVMMAHLVGFGAVTDDLLAWPGGHEAVFAVTRLRFGYESFFVLSGYFAAVGFSKSATGPMSIRGFVTRRTLRLMIPYWGAIVLAALDRWLPNVLLGHGNPLPSGGELAAMAFCVQDVFGVPNIIGDFWSMATTLQFLAIWSATFWVVRRRHAVRGAADPHLSTERLIAVFAILLFIGSLASRVTGHLPANWSLPAQSMFFAAGIAMHYAKSGRMPLIFGAAIVAILLIFGILGLERTYCAAAIACVAVSAIPPRSGTSGSIAPIRLLGALGGISYSLYLTHGVVGHRVLNLTNHLVDIAPWISMLFLFGSFAASVLFASVFHRVVETPASSIAQRYRSPDAANEARSG